MSAQADTAEPGVLSDAFASEAAFDAWYERVLPRVYGYVYSRCGHDADLAEELTQLTFIAAVRQGDRFQRRADVVTWLCAIARNKIADHYRQLDREERRRSRLIIRELTVVPADAWRAIDERDLVSRALVSLPAIQRAALILSTLDQLPVRETAVLIGKSESATESILVRARANFRDAYLRARGASDG